MGIAQGYATIGAIGFEGRWDYGAIGTVTNLAARLCAEAQGGQVLITSRVAAAVEDLVQAEEVGALALRGLTRPGPDLQRRRAQAAGLTGAPPAPAGRQSARALARNSSAEGISPNVAGRPAAHST